jgi:type IV pilus assembly protein PilE
MTVHEEGTLMMNVRKKGFTLIEVMIVVAIVAILAAIAVPAFLSSIKKGRRSDAMQVIMNVQMAQERWRANDTDYATLAELGISSTSPGGHYSVAVSGNTATNYVITATAQTPQDTDSCGNFVLTNTAGVIVKTTSKGLTDRCWTK